ncbi:hypothetical protein HYE54_08520 [Aggregatibacter actinomycetemcomitans]|uniref:hypothetical protein n=1 Tax=Aggregatibacter actinomycetemcomitans TaxID=714 RepID=UPI00197B50A6|nr:hypothetical protein [Aggregatibacter actinomycetemcomitans]MBN6068771.1 hypothetical protein [Aggregatibacter actinomycetemcomitans]MBN6086726.1 hypothetical protein [Aggregatibacter actinomycetemcomitans]
MFDYQQFFIDKMNKKINQRIRDNGRKNYSLIRELYKKTKYRFIVMVECGAGYKLFHFDKKRKAKAHFKRMALLNIGTVVFVNICKDNMNVIVKPQPEAEKIAVSNIFMDEIAKRGTEWVTI